MIEIFMSTALLMICHYRPNRCPRPSPSPIGTTAALLPRRHHCTDAPDAHLSSPQRARHQLFFEPIDEYIDRYGLEEVYCYSSDFPHLEGGKDPMTRFSNRLERLGPAIMEKFFVTNGEYLLPA
jgi:hypothetical protein